MPRVSVVTPVYNGAAFIANNIRSVMAQTFSDWEHIIVDDCSTDGSVEIIRSFPHVQLIQMERNGGPARALNQGYAAARGEYFAWVSADDGYLPTYLEKAVALLDERPEAVCAHAGTYFVDAAGFILMVRKCAERTGITPRDLLIQNPVHGSSTLFRREIFEKLGGFNEDLIGTPDTDMWIRMLMHGDFCHIAEPVTFASRHPNQDSRKRSHLVTQNQLWLADETVKRFGHSCLVSAHWDGPRDGRQAEAAGWFDLALAKAGTIDNSLAIEWIRRARELDPSNPRYRLMGAVAPTLGELRFRIRKALAPIASRMKSAQSRATGLNVHAMNRAQLRECPFLNDNGPVAASAAG